MASKGTGSGKWKRKAMYKARAAHARAAKLARLQKNRSDMEPEVGEDPMEETAVSTCRSGKDDADAGSGDGELEGQAMCSNSENDRGDSSSNDESDFSDDKAQDIFDDWIVSLTLADRKMLSVLLFDSFRERQKMSVKEAAQESASIAGFNEKTVRRYRKEFYENKGKFKETKQGNYM